MMSAMTSAKVGDDISVGRGVGEGCVGCVVSQHWYGGRWCGRKQMPLSKEVQVEGEEDSRQLPASCGMPLCTHTHPKGSNATCQLF